MLTLTMVCIFRALEHARAVELDFTDEGSEDDVTCPVCGDSE